MAESTNIKELFDWHDFTEGKNANKYSDRTNAGFT